jgi:glycosyltransferase involved in cell wall biosynthesis/SAM-dependent methyltransferase
MDICTIIAKNYVAQARVLARSFAEHHPAGRCFVLVIDEYDGFIDPGAEPFTILTPSEIGCAEFAEMAVRYDVLELSTAVKPWLLAHLLSGERQAITYLDPDIRIYGSLDELDELARAHGVVLTPHNTEPVPDDGERPGQIDILLAGVYNLGYLSLGAGEETERLLGWWRERLVTDCRVDPMNGYFVDQRWFDLAPGLMSDHAIVRSPQYNLAYWNIYCRRLVHDGDRYEVDGTPLAFFHFSGFDARYPDVLSRHQTRVRAGGQTALGELCREYAREVLAAGYGETVEWQYTYAGLPSGIDFNRRLRRLHAIATGSGQVIGSPFTHEGEDSFLKWLAAPAPGGPPHLNRMLAEVYASRPDLQAAFTDVPDGNAQGFLGWAREAGVVEEPVLRLLPIPEPGPDEVAAPGTDSADRQDFDSAATSKSPAEWGVNVVGYFRSELGTGEAARQALSALDASAVPVLPVHGRAIPPNRQGHAFTHLDYTDASYPVNLICMNADRLDEFAAEAGQSFFSSRYSIGMWFWEVEQFPDRWMSAFDHLDELWLPTEHISRAIAPVSPIPIVKITLPVELPPVVPAARTTLDLPEGFMFLFSFDHHSVFDRKNPVAVIEAYTRAFEPGAGTVLVIKSINADSALADHERLVAAAKGRPDIHIIDGYLTPGQKNQMMASCDCYVSLHRAEGFGLTMAEAMYLDKPVVATGYSGNLDFMTDRNSYLVEHRLVEIGTSAAPYPPEGWWAEPDVDHAARLLREVFDSPEMAAERARRGGQDIRRTHSPAAAGEIMRGRLELIEERHGDRLRKLPATRSSALEPRIQAGPVASPMRRMARVRRLARRVLLRVLKPYSAYQQGMDVEIARSLTALEEKLDEQELVANHRHAMLLAELRTAQSQRSLWEQVADLARAYMALDASTQALGVSTQALEVSAQALEASTQALEVSTQAVPARLDELARAIAHIEWETHAIPYMEGSLFGDVNHPQLGLVQGYALEPNEATVDAYRSFEDIFRGSEKLIRERQQVFLALLGEHAPVLDFGCGRGEFLDLLAGSGIPHLAVDSDAGMVRRCRDKGHTDVVEGDGLEYLESLEDASLGAIFCAQVIEHLPYEALVRFMELARRKLREEGVLLLETVNPHCPSALKTFWVDPTHQHPIFPEVALHLCRSAGFATALLFHPNGTGDAARDRFTQGEYAVLAGGESLRPRQTRKGAFSSLEQADAAAPAAPR